MRIRRAGVQGSAVLALLLAAISVLPASGHTPAVSCESLGALKPLHTTITRAQGVRAGAFTGPAGRGQDREAVFKSLPAFCRVEATIRPVPDSEINIEVWLPVSGWNSKLQSVGGVGRHHQLSRAFRRGRGRLRRRRDRHRTRREHRQLRDWTSREGGRLRLSPGARDDRSRPKPSSPRTMVIPPAIPTGTAARPAEDRRWLRRSDTRMTTKASLRGRRRTA
jgi:hypothetical protein